MRRITLFAILFSLPIESVSAQQTHTTIERSISVVSGKPDRVGVYVNIKPDCTSGPLPVLRVAEPPHNGQIVVELVNIRITNVGSCLGTEAPGFIASYESQPGFQGDDKVIIEIKFPDRGNAARLETITISVRAPGMKL
jgi:hypothetical protein